MSRVNIDATSIPLDLAAQVDRLYGLRPTRIELIRRSVNDTYRLQVADGNLFLRLYAPNAYFGTQQYRSNHLLQRRPRKRRRLRRCQPQTTPQPPSMMPILIRKRAAISSCNVATHCGEFHRVCVRIHD